MQKSLFLKLIFGFFSFFDLLMIADVLKAATVSIFVNTAEILNRMLTTSLKERYLFMRPSLLLALTDSISFSSERLFLDN